MSNKWTEKQNQAIKVKGKNVLIAAAAGSGKTAVLVERVIDKVLTQNIDIDKLLIVTFTKAAANEMRERILDAIYKKLEENPENQNLQKQILLLNKANISTIHSFCLDVIKNNFYELENLSPNFRLADTAEIELIQREILDDLFETLYENKNEAIIKLTDTYCGYRDDENLKDMLLDIYKFIQSTPFPKEWLNEAVEKFNLENKLEEDFMNTTWGDILVQSSKEEILSAIKMLNTLIPELINNEELKKYLDIILEDIKNLQKILEANSWDLIFEEINKIKFKTWPRNTKIDLEDIKKVRDSAKGKLKELKDKIFMYKSIQANSDIYEIYDILINLKDVLENFMSEYSKAKREKNIIDFNDIEHFALKILLKEEVAKKYQQKFEEIIIDEYQDSNLVQEYILNSVSKGNNVFMVGDVKQSIYKFRQARPELFLEKYNTYLDDINQNENPVKIQLFENFRSRKNILDLCNIIFKNIMTKSIGDIDYTKKEFLNAGLEYPEPKEGLEILQKSELHIIDLKQENEDDNNEVIDNIILEAKFVAKRIKELLESNLYVFDKKKGYRKLTYKDIVILLRTTNNVAQVYEKELENLEIPVFTDVGANYLDSIEIQTIISILKIIENPNNDIPLVTVLRSPICEFNDNELIKIRIENKNATFFTALKEYKEEDNIKDKIDNFFELLEDLQNKKETLKLYELIWYIYNNTGYYNYVNLLPNGNLKVANLRMIAEKANDFEKGSFKGLYNFINFIERVRKNGSDTGAPKLIGENENVIRIMSIHKSKGLEFPIVFLSGTGKQFNFQDLNQEIILHQDIGIGHKYINYERRIKYDTLAKEAIKIKAKNEILSEEMRILYVALTRSREKLIITGINKDLERDLAEKENMIKAYEKIHPAILKKSKSFLDWLELVVLYDEKIKNVLDIEYHKPDFENEERNTNIKVPKLSLIYDDEINKLLNWRYENLELTKLEGKTSVSKISKDEYELAEKHIVPKFLQEKVNLTKAEIGSTLHLIMQKLDFSINYNREKVEALLNNLCENEIISEKQKATININQILKFTNSDLYKRIQNAEKVFVEEPFYINIPANEVYETNFKNDILVQGIMDLYFIENGEIVLVDYKTDYIAKGKEEILKDRYKKQLELYRKALKSGTEKNIKEVIIYSTHLNNSIKIEY